MIRTLGASLIAAALAGCSSLTPFVTGPPALAPGEKDPGKRVSICYSSLKTSAEKIREMAQAQCPAASLAEPFDTDLRMDNCPVMTPARATFLCKPVK
jgi:hypothetical protein